MTTQEHLDEILRLADQMRPHIQAIPGAFNVRVSREEWFNCLEVHFNEASDVIAIVPTATTFNSVAGGTLWRHCRTKVGAVYLVSCEPIETEVSAVE